MTTRTHKDDIAAALDTQIEAAKRSFAENENHRKKAAYDGDSYTAVKFAVAAARDRDRLVELLQQRAGAQPADNGVRSGQFFVGGHS
jgi:hypothetical protein